MAAPVPLYDRKELPRPRRWTRAEFYRALEAGVFRPDERLELLDGEVIEQVGENPPHSAAVRLSRGVLEAAFAGTLAFVSEQHPISLEGTESEPEPDLAVVAGGVREFEQRHPAADDLLLVVEVSNTTLAFDRATKATLYAASGIPEYWILNLTERRLEVYRSPENGAYQHVSLLADTMTVSPLSAPQSVIAVTDLLPAAPAE